MIRLTNTLGNKKQEFKPITEAKVGMYTCGPTVYDDVHIGNLRAFVTPDILKRALKWNNYEVKHVMNITDVGIGGDNDEGEDKIIRGLKREGKPVTMEAMKELTETYAEHFKNDLAKLNIEMPDAFPKASEHIKEDIELIETLEKKGFAYKAESAVYFDTSKDKHYGKLGRLTKEDESVARVEGGGKKHSRDFALWKLNPSLGYESPWGKGFPGWHIECSAMSRKYLGDHFDIHTGGVDLVPIHHNNEIAQSENACGCDFVNYWIHNAHVNVASGKMAKSEGTGLTLASIIEKGFDPLAYRYWLLTAHYRSPVEFSFEALEGAQNAYAKLKERVSELPDSGSALQSHTHSFTEAINDDLDTPKAIGLIWDMVKDDSASEADKKATILAFDTILGLDLGRIIEVPEDVKKLAEERNNARLSKDWKKADELRVQIEQTGFEVKDTEKGYRIIKKARA